MARRNYNQSVRTRPAVEDQTPREPVQEQVWGIVDHCMKLNIRATPDKDARILEVVDAGTRLTIYPAGATDETDEWYKVQLSKARLGYCMKAYVTLME